MSFEPEPESEPLLEMKSDVKVVSDCDIERIDKKVKEKAEELKPN